MRPIIIQPAVCSNRFKILEEEDEPGSTFLVGDSMTRQHLTECCGRVKCRRRLFCMPGVGIDAVTDMMDKVSEEATNESLFVVPAGTNDALKTRSEEVSDKYRKLIHPTVQNKVQQQYNHHLRRASQSQVCGSGLVLQ